MLELTVDLGDCFSGPLDVVHTAELLEQLAAVTLRGNHDLALVCGIHDNWDATAIPHMPQKALKWLAVVLMLPAFILFAGSLTTKNPTAIGGQGAEPRGMIRITRHPMLWSFAIWAILHALANGTQSGLVFFGAIAAGRTRLELGELVLPVAIGTLAWAGLLAMHHLVIGVSPFPP